MTDQRQIDTAAACEILSKIDHSFSLYQYDAMDGIRQYLGRQILRRALDYLRDPQYWALSRNLAPARTPTARFWEGECLRCEDCGGYPEIGKRGPRNLCKTCREFRKAFTPNKYGEYQ